MEKLQERYRKLLVETTTRFHRYMFAEINWKARMIGLTGPRGVGKTTLVLQHIREQMSTDDSLYVTAEDFYFVSHKLIDLAETFVKFGGKHLFIDEIHKYEGWAHELKLIYDYYPDLQVVFTGSSVLDINKGASDLSRRVTMYHMQGLSFREYLELFRGIKLPVYSLDDVLRQKVELPKGFRPLAEFKEYLRHGYYPYAKEEDFQQKLMQVITNTIEVDIPNFSDISLSTARKLKRLLAIISQSVPFKPNVSSIANALSVSRNSVPNYCLLLEMAGMIAQLRDDTGGIRGLGKVEKVYLDNTNLIFCLVGENADTGNLRETFFFNQLRVRHDVIVSSVSDFQIGDITFEVGGKGKGQKQIAQAAKGYVVKDDIETGYANIIPLWQLGLVY